MNVFTLFGDRMYLREETGATWLVHLCVCVCVCVYMTVNVLVYWG